MKRWAQLALSIVVLAPAAHAAETDLAVELPAVTLTLPRVSPSALPAGRPPVCHRECARQRDLGVARPPGLRRRVGAREGDLGPTLAVLETGDPAGLVAEVLDREDCR